MFKMAPQPTPLVFKVNRRETELIAPAKPTPREFKPLSDIDDQQSLRFQIPIIQFYRYDPSTQGKDPANVIREALAKPLVFYYPFAGRLREWPNRKLVVECTGEGILFIEADADVTLEQFGDALQPPFSCLEEVLFDVPGSSGVLNCPLLHIQCRTIALQPDPNEEMGMICVVGARNRLDPPLPTGYYGNAFGFPAAVATADNLSQNPLGYALELVRKAKAVMTKEYMQSVADLMAIKDRPHFTVVRSYLVSDVRRAGFEEVDFGWGKPVYGGPAKARAGAIPGGTSFYVPYKNRKREQGIVLLICLPADAMERFVQELEKMLKKQPTIVASAL